jgi:hypothetical protein
MACGVTLRTPSELSEQEISMNSEITGVQELDSNERFEVTGGDWFGADSGLSVAFAAAAGLVSMPALIIIAGTIGYGLL